ncbi:MAG: hypothetical protein GX946_06455 [Oligosphaeraceae bacterium]|nr:hypothetical protein [Oligosphaeraceae bacterium]
MLKSAYHPLFLLSALLFLTAVALAESTAAKPVWAGNQLGMEALSPDYRDPEFPPLQVSGNLVMAGFKRMTLNGTGLPQSINWKDSAILKKPAFLRLNDQIIEEAHCQLEKNGGNAALGKASFATQGINFEVQSHFEFDFTVRFDISLSPAKETANIRQLALVFPMNTELEAEKLVMYYAEGPNRLESGLEAQKRRLHLTLKPGDTRPVSPGFCSIFWIGTVNYGLSWNFESAREWNPVKGNEMVYEPESGHFKLNLIEKPMVLKEKITFSFYLTATPIRNMPKNWRAWNYTWRGNATQKFDRSLFNQLVYWPSIWRGGMYNPLVIRNPEALQRCAVEDAGMNKANYYIPQLNTPVNTWEDEDGTVYVLEDSYLHQLCKKYRRLDVFKMKDLDIPEDAVYFKSLEERNKVIGAEEDHITRERFTMSGLTYDVVYVPELADHMVYALNEFIKLGVGGIYYDGINPQHTYADWAAWIDPDGDTRPVFHFQHQRDLLKRMRTVVKKANPSEIIIAHQSGTRPVSTLSLCDVILAGETFHYAYHEPEKRDASPSSEFYYAHIVGDIDNLKGEFFHRQWGVPHILLPEVTSCIKDSSIAKVTQGTRTMLAYTLHFDMLYHTTMCDVQEIYKIYRIRNEYGMADTNEDIVEFVPYWENEMFPSSLPEVKVSFYNKVKQQELYTSYDISKKYLVIASNLQFSEATFSIKIPKGLKKTKIREMQSGEKLAVKPRQAEFNWKLPPYEFAIFEVTGEHNDRGGHW